MNIEIHAYDKIIYLTINNNYECQELFKKICDQLKIKYSLNLYILITDKNKILRDGDKIEKIREPSTNSHVYYFLENQKKENTSKIKKSSTPIRQIIMECTSAEKPLEEIKKVEKLNSNVIFNLGGNGGNNINNFLELLQIFQENGNLIRRIGQQNQRNVEPNENSLRELIAMGFSEDRARQALINARNDVNLATEILLGDN